MAINRKDYDEYTDVAKLRAQLAAQEALKPAAYTNPYAAESAALLGEIQNRPKFNYDANSDALYQAMKSTAVREGRRASADVMGQAAQLTGGYGNSYAASAAAQAYQSRLAQLSNSIPQLAQYAQNRYDAETQNLYNRYNLYRQADADEYGRYRDTVGDYQNRMNMLLNRLNNEQSRAENMYQYDTNREWQQQQFDYQKAQDAIANSQKWASMAQSSNEAALKAQIADLKGQISNSKKGATSDGNADASEYNYGTMKPSEKIKREIAAEINANRYTEQEARQYVWKQYVDKGYDPDEIADIIKQASNFLKRKNF